MLLSAYCPPCKYPVVATADKENSEVAYKDLPHTYQSKKTNKNLISVTTWIGKMKPEVEYVTYGVERKLALSKEEVLLYWQHLLICSQLRGNFIHDVIETRKATTKEGVWALRKFDESLSKLYGYNGLSGHSLPTHHLTHEMLLSNEELEMAGKSDIVVHLRADGIKPERISIHDIKTNEKDLRKEVPAQYKRYFKGALCDIEVTTMNEYVIQLHIYAYIVSKQFELPIDTLYLHHYNGWEYELIPIEYNPTLMSKILLSIKNKEYEYL